MDWHPSGCRRRGRRRRGRRCASSFTSPSRIRQAHAAALALAAGERRLDALLLEELQQHLVAAASRRTCSPRRRARPRAATGPARLAASSASSSWSSASAAASSPAAASHLREVAERVAAQRDELLLVPARRAGTRAPSARRPSPFTNGAGPYMNAVVRRVRRRERLQLGRVGSPWTDSSQCTTRQPVWVSRGELAQLVGEDHRALVAIGVEEHDPCRRPSRRRCG